MRFAWKPCIGPMGGEGGERGEGEGEGERGEGGGRGRGEKGGGEGKVDTA